MSKEKLSDTSLICGISESFCVELPVAPCSVWYVQHLMSSKLLAVVHGKAFLQLIGNSRKGLNSSFIERIILSVVNSESNKITRLAFNMSTEAAGLSHSENGIALPVTEASTVFRTGGALTYRRSVGNSAAFVLGFALLVFPFETHAFL